MPYTGPIKLVLFDVDGVLTDGRLFFDAHGESLKVFNAKDGVAVALLRFHGIRSGIVSGRSGAALDIRVKQLAFDVAVTGESNKLVAVRRLANEMSISLPEIAYVGDDIFDVPLAGSVGTFFAPSDAHRLVLAKADVVLGVAGGLGVVREAAERILEADGMSIEAMYAGFLDRSLTPVVQ